MVLLPKPAEPVTRRPTPCGTFTLRSPTPAFMVALNVPCAGSVTDVVPAPVLRLRRVRFSCSRLSVESPTPVLTLRSMGTCELKETLQTRSPLPVLKKGKPQLDSVLRV